MLRSTGASCRERYGMSSADHDSGDARVHDGRAERILEGSNEDGFIDELVLAATQLADFLGQGWPPGGRLRGDIQCLERRAAVLAHAKHAGEQFGDVVLALLRGLQRIGVVLAGQNDFRDAAHRLGRSLGVVSLDPLHQQPHDRGTGHGMEFFDDGHIRQRRLHLRPVSTTGLPARRDILDVAPAIGPRGAKNKERINAFASTICHDPSLDFVPFRNFANGTTKRVLALAALSSCVHSVTLGRARPAVGCNLL